MGLGLIVGVAALGVVSARSVVERRQQIGVLRAIGFRRGMVQACFLLESSFVALTAIVVGTALGLAVAYNVISDTRRQPSWSGMPLRRAVAHARADLRGRLRRRDAHDAGARAARLARLSRRGAALPVAAHAHGQRASCSVHGRTAKFAVQMAISTRGQSAERRPARTRNASATVAAVTLGIARRSIDRFR